MTDSTRFEDRAGMAVVTGGSGGIGASIVGLLAARGSDVAFTYHRNEEAAAKVAEIVKGYGRVARHAAVDVTDARAVKLFVGEAAESDESVFEGEGTAGPVVRLSVEAHV